MTTVALPAQPAGRPLGWWGMLLVVASEATLFAVLLASYFYLRFKTPAAWPPDGIADPRLVKASIMAVLLVVSGITAWYSARGARQESLRRQRLGLAATFLLGVAFVVLQVLELRDLLGVVRPSTDAYTSIFFTITGLHGAHVIVGLLLIAWTQLFALRGAYRSEESVAVSVAVLYWEFVVVVWLFEFLALYLTPRL